MRSKRTLSTVTATYPMLRLLAPSPDSSAPQITGAAESCGCDDAANLCLGDYCKGVVRTGGHAHRPGGVVQIRFEVQV